MQSQCRPQPRWREGGAGKGIRLFYLHTDWSLDQASLGEELWPLELQAILLDREELWGHTQYLQ